MTTMTAEREAYAIETFGSELSLLYNHDEEDLINAEWWHRADYVEALERRGVPIGTRGGPHPADLDAWWPRVARVDGLADRGDHRPGGGSK